jgi:hypothetical protein
MQLQVLSRLQGHSSPLTAVLLLHGRGTEYTGQAGYVGFESRYLLSSLRFSWYSSVSPGKCRDNVLNYATIASFHILPNSLLTITQSFESYTNEVTDNSVKGTTATNTNMVHSPIRDYCTVMRFHNQWLYVFCVNVLFIFSYLEL